jgi:hypothetical protein
MEKHNGFNLFFKSIDKNNTVDYLNLVNHGVASVEEFFHSAYRAKFDLYIHPDRHSLDSTWQTDWNMPDFRSECWMVASGIASRVDMISPKMWEKEACEHIYSDAVKTQQLITHELVHVFHGQRNISPDFSNVEGIDWFVEGLATYASGQVDPIRISEIKDAISGNKIPDGLDLFWSGRLKYGLSGSVVMFIDYKYGRTRLLDLLSVNNKKELLLQLGTTESGLLEEWQMYMRKL